MAAGDDGGPRVARPTLLWVDLLFGSLKSVFGCSVGELFNVGVFCEAGLVAS
jgi:hypothetical protein